MASSRESVGPLSVIVKNDVNDRNAMKLPEIIDIDVHDMETTSEQARRLFQSI